MLSYQHQYHAGNFADVLKHIILINVIDYFKLKDKPFCYVDTHAGRGLYQLTDVMALKNQEFLTGIGKLWQHTDLPENVEAYVNVIKSFNLDNRLVWYPGSPVIATQLLRKTDRLFCYELHPQEFKYLSGAIGQDKRVKVFCADGLSQSLGLLPPKERRALVLIDPSYELKNEYNSVLQALISFHKKFSTACYVVWYPVVSRAKQRGFEKKIKAAGIANIQLLELGVKPDHTDFGMTASGMIVINPPWTLKQQMEATLPWLANSLGEANQGYWRFEQLTPETI